MTREEAISVLNMVEAHGLADEAKKEAIKALEQEPCEDCVSRQEVIGLFAKNADAVRPYSQTWKEVKSLPPVTPHKKGKWVDDKLLVWCSECNTAFTDTYNYCPNCGAEMESEK